MNFFSNFVLYSRPYLNTLNQHYQNIVTINVFPKGPLGRFVRTMRFNPLSEFKNYGNKSNSCGLALFSLHNNKKIMTVDEIPDLFSFLLSNGYTIDTSLTDMINKSDYRFQTENANQIICFVTFKFY